MIRLLVPLARAASRNRRSGSQPVVQLELFDEDILRNMLENLEDDLLKEYATQVAHNIVDAAPVDTGELRGSIGVSNDLSNLPQPVSDLNGGRTKQRIDEDINSLNMDKNFVIGSSAEHAQYVEFGTTDQVAQPFMRQEIANHSYNADVAARRIRPRRS